MIGSSHTETPQAQVASPVASVSTISPVATRNQSRCQTNDAASSPQEDTEKSNVEPLPTVVESSSRRNDDLDVPDFLK